MPVPEGQPALDHEAGDDAVKNQAVIEALVGQRDEIAHALRGVFGIQYAGKGLPVLQP